MNEWSGLIGFVAGALVMCAGIWLGNHMRDKQ